MDDEPPEQKVQERKGKERSKQTKYCPTGTPAIIDTFFGIDFWNSQEHPDPRMVLLPLPFKNAP